MKTTVTWPNYSTTGSQKLKLLCSISIYILTNIMLIYCKKKIIKKKQFPISYEINQFWYNF